MLFLGWINQDRRFLFRLRLQFVRASLIKNQCVGVAHPRAVVVLPLLSTMPLPMQQKNVPWLHKKRSQAAAQQRLAQTTQQAQAQQAPVAQQVLQQAAPAQQPLLLAATPLRLVTAPAATAP